MIGASTSNSKISIIIPVLNEEKYLKRLLPYLIYHAGGHCEIIVVDGGSKDASMEDFEYVQRMQRVLDFHIIPKNVRASSRKYRNNSYFRVNLANAIAFGMFRAGQKPEKGRKRRR